MRVKKMRSWLQTGIISVLIVSAGGLADLAAASGGERHALFTDILKAHVVDGHVDYANLCEDERLGQYLAALSATDPDALPDDATKHAFWINAYNAFTLQAICSEYPVSSINELHFGGRIIGHVLKKTVWDQKFIVINGDELSLNDIEHNIVRPRFGDYRSHFALVCAAKSCPPLRSEAFEGFLLDAQLDDQGRVFFADEGKNRFDQAKRIAYLSKILDWYKDDFASNDGALLLAVADFLPDALAADIRRNRGDWKVRHTDYDWSLND